MDFIDNDGANIIYKDVIYNKDYIMKQINSIKFYFINLYKDEVYPVGIVLPRSPWIISSMIALYELHIPFVPIDIELPQERIEYMLDNSNVQYIITSKYLTIELKNQNKINIESAFREGSINITKSFINDIAYILYTSGSSGFPKGVMIQRKGFDNFIKAIPKEIDFTKDKKIICLTSFSFDIVFLETLLPLYYGMTVVLASEEEKNNPRNIIKLINKYQIKMIQFVPSRLLLMQTVDKEFKFLRDIEDIMIGGEQLSVSLLKRLKESTNSNIYNMYGPTETTIWSTISNLTNKEKIDIGKPILNTKIYIMNDALSEVPFGEIGEICIAGEGVGKGYINNLEQTKKAFVEYLPTGEILYKTGDIGKYNLDGNLLCLGRIDNQVKIHGFRIELEEIDTKLAIWEKIIASATCFKETDLGGELVTFYISEEHIHQKEFIQFLKNILPHYMIPNIFIKVDFLKYTSSGKLDRKALLENYKNTSCEKFIEDDFNVESELLETQVLEKILLEFNKLFNQTQELNQSDKFIDLGIDSLRYIQIVTYIEEEYDIEFEDNKLSITTFNTIKDFYNYVINLIYLKEN